MTWTHHPSAKNQLYCDTLASKPFSWESLKKAIGGFKRELTVQDMLSEQAWERQFDGNGDNGISRGGGGNGSGGPEDEGFAGQFDEFLQVIIAVVGVALMYTLMIGGEELTRLTRDYIKYLFGAKPSVRLTHSMEKWRKFYKRIAQ
ncbi:glycine-rich protein [Musa troglodytarum]|uniref:Glycine-rich protein n=1 Tax=Musa troglodytarum TaxID=320322 RepID=A0A9E7EV58_9LILI|nr:glycine-rich protein [Musa troglodytarum]